MSSYLEINLMDDLNSLNNFSNEVKSYLKIFDNEKDYFIRAYKSVFTSFCEALDDIVNSLFYNYKEENTIDNIFLINLENSFIFLRKLLESNLILNIFKTDQETLFKEYIEQSEKDLSHVSKMFNEKTLYFNSSDKKTINRYDWINQACGIKIKSLTGLVDITSMNEFNKNSYKTYISDLNMLTHPNLYSDGKFHEIVRTQERSDLTYIFEVTEKNIQDMCEVLIYFENKRCKNITYDLTKIFKTRTILNIFNVNYYKKDLTKQNLPNNKSLTNYSYLKGNSIPYAYRAELIFFNLVLTMETNNKLKNVKKRVLQKILDHYGEYARELLLSYYRKDKSYYYIKIRQILEYASYIVIILESDDLKLETFQSYTDIFRYSTILNYYSLWNEDISSVIKQKLAGSDLTLEMSYYKNLDLMKKYIKDEFNMNVKTNLLRRANSWLFNGRKIPSTWEIIKTNITKLDDEIAKDIDYYSGLYSISSLYSHINEFSLSNEDLSNEDFYKESFKRIFIILEKVYRLLFNNTLDEFQVEFKDIFKGNENAINRILKTL